MNTNINETGKTKAPRKWKGGRPPKTDPATHPVMVRFNDTQYNSFLSLFERSGMQTKARFIMARIFDEQFKVIKIDKAAVDYYTRLTSFYSQFRGLATNYNQVVKIMNSHFTKKTSLAFLYKLETQTRELAVLCKKITALTEEFERKWLQK